MLLALVLVAGEALAAAPAYEEIQVADGGKIAGQVRLTSAAPPRARLKIDKDQAVCGAHQDDQTYLVAADGGLANTVVVLDDIARGKPLGRLEATLDQKGCHFTPRVLAFPKGTKLEMRSSDPVLHNTHAQRGGKTLFNVALPLMNMKVSKKFKEPGVHQLGCEVHTFMKGWAFVTAHPYVVVTDARGRFELADVPAGTYRVRAWHEAAGEKTLEGVAVKAAETSAIDLSF